MSAWWTWTTLVAAFLAVLVALAAWWMLSDAIVAIGAGVSSLLILKSIELLSARGRGSR